MFHLFSIKSGFLNQFMVSPLLKYQKRILQSFPLTETIARSLKYKAFCIKLCIIYFGSNLKLM